MVDKPGAGEPGAPSGTDRSIGELVSDATDNLSRLVRLEIKLAKLEAKADAVKIGKGIGEFLAAGVILHLFVILLSVTIGLGLWEIFDLPLWGAFGIVTLFYLLVAVAFVLTALINFRRRQGLARTAETSSRLVAILRGDIRPPKGERSVVAATTDQAPVSSDSSV
ncbi:phage holin family protein [Nocardiopsis sp. YSL2]|uniref:phage holin family protein n=1 Tax=Nocardiopsis sp. YSL2 TaxID=2939492 RepID=UPI0026F44DB5|nr:phage holin family protein [Nocardiopsis sp. YSL2]